MVDSVSGALVCLTGVSLGSRLDLTNPTKSRRSKKVSFCLRLIWLLLLVATGEMRKVHGFVCSESKSFSFGLEERWLRKPKWNPRKNPLIVPSTSQGYLMATQEQQEIVEKSSNKKKVVLSGRRPSRKSRNVVKIYADYATRLWNETNHEARKQIAREKAIAAVKHVQHVLRDDVCDGNEDLPRNFKSPQKIQAMLQACQEFLQDDDYQQGVGGSKSASASGVLNQGTISSFSSSPTYKEFLVRSSEDIQGSRSYISSNPTTQTLWMEENSLEEYSDLSGRGPSSANVALLSNNSEVKEFGVLKSENSVTPTGETTQLIQRQPDNTVIGKKPKSRRSILFGAMMGLVVAGWVFSGNYIFTGLFTLMTILGQLEYYRMVINTGVYPARRISVVGACSMFLTALFCPQHHQIILPLFGLWAMIWFLTMKRTVTTIPEIAATFTGMFYLGYVPSFWVRIRLLGGNREPTRLAPLLGPILQSLQKKAQTNLPDVVYPMAIHLPITTGAIFIFWTWLCLAFSDVGAYFVGKNFGKTKLGSIAPAAGATSPNKTVEGLLGGCAVSALLGILGAWVQKWPFWFWTGMLHGTLLGVIGLIGDLTASMIKRDAGIKDFGDLLPEHGGILDRVDSFVWAAPYSWLVCNTIIPALKKAVS